MYALPHCNKSISPTFFNCRCISGNLWLDTTGTSSGKFCCCCFILQNYQILSMLTYEISSTPPFLGILEYFNFQLNSRFSRVGQDFSKSQMILIRTFFLFPLWVFFIFKYIMGIYIQSIFIFPGFHIFEFAY